jgi:hypothetical protein
LLEVLERINYLVYYDSLYSDEVVWIQQKDNPTQTIVAGELIQLLLSVGNGSSRDAAIEDLAHIFGGKDRISEGLRITSQRLTHFSQETDHISKRLSYLELIYQYLSGQGDNNQPLINDGGDTETRFWPLSRQDCLGKNETAPLLYFDGSQLCTPEKRTR